MMKNRELKFRIWNGVEMVYDVMVGKFGTFYVNPSNNGIDVNDSACLTRGNTKYNSNIPVMQYTGLKDKNGVEIYEGDIVYITTPDGLLLTEIGFQNGSFGYYLPLDLGKMFVSFESGRRVTKIVANIYQNPELLKK